MYIDAGPGRSAQNPLCPLPEFDVLNYVLKMRAGGWILTDCTGTKKDAEASIFNDLQTSMELCRSIFGAGNETRTRDPDLGKVVLYQLSYSRVLVMRIL